MTTLRVHRGDSWNFDGVVTRAGVAVDLTGATLQFLVSRDLGETPDVTAEIGSGITVADPTSGAYTIAISPADTAFTSETIVETYRWQLTCVEQDGTTSTPDEGLIIISPKLTT